ncbi:MAG: tyrosine-type recombinase/integrase [Candidatus Thorarchaeota archaeon]
MDYLAPSNILKFPKISDKKIRYQSDFLSKTLTAINETKRIKIRAQKNITGKYHLYLDYFYRGKRERQFLRIYIENKKTPRSIEKIKEAEILHDRKEVQLYGMSEPEEFRLNKQKYRADFVEYFEYLAINRKNYDTSWMNTLKHLKIFTEDKTVTFAQISMKFSEEFKLYLEKNLAPNTAHTYFSKFKTTLNHAIQQGILDKASPAQFLTIKKQPVLREFLDIEELRKLKNTPCTNEQVKRAFLFACHTGLCISDIKKLQWKDIRGDYILIRQTKTDEPLNLRLHETAKSILEQQEGEFGEMDHTSPVFDLIPSENKINKHIKHWTQAADIYKHVTFHIARHTFATLLLSSDIDIYTVSKLLGHKDVKVTQIYAKLIDKKKDEAIDRLPII